VGAVTTPLILTLNEGSSSIKFALFAAEDGLPEITAESVDAGMNDGALFDRIHAALRGGTPAAICHRIVHGGPALGAPVMIDEATLAQLRAAAAFAPLHNPAALALIAAAGRHYPGVPQMACFDTGFHASLPDIAAVLPIPRSLRAQGVRRYGFHGLSCQSILHQLGGEVPERLIIAHLGNGASVTAVRAGRSVDTSMGLTPSGGVVMGTRAGDLDPGFLLYLMREHGMDATAIEDVIDRQSGMLGISGISGDLRPLRASSSPDAALAIAMFCRSVAKQVAGMAVVLGGVDLLVFTGGIGEHDPGVREQITAELAGAGFATFDVAILPSRENEQMARDARALLAAVPAE
jgi:acetate kinase